MYLASDLHQDISPWPEPFEVPADAVVLIPGDVGNGPHALQDVRRLFPSQKIFFVPGNHDFFGGTLEQGLNRMKTIGAELDITVLYNDSALWRDWRILGTTLWSDFELNGAPERDMLRAHEAVHDFDHIFKDHRFTPWTPEDMAEEHARCQAWLKHSLAQPHNGRTLVMTHFWPSPHAVVPKSMDESLAAYFCSNQEGLMKNVSLWVHGHSRRCMSYQVGETQIRCHPRGLDLTPDQRENPHFRQPLLIEE